MVVEWREPMLAFCVQDDQGQSILEFVLMLPVMVAMTLILIRVNTAIQMSIVNQQYARSQALFIAYNNPYYPRKGTGASNRLIVGVSDNVAPGGDSDNDRYEPQASTFNITRFGVQGTGQPDRPDDKLRNTQKRANIRIFNTVALCTQLKSVGGTPYTNALVRDLDLMRQGNVPYCNSERIEVNE